MARFKSDRSFQLFFALAVPLEDPYKSISLANFFEATYTLPTNASDELPWTEIERARRRRRGLDRATVYQAVANKFIR